MNNTKSTNMRNSSFELLRIVAMLMIVVFHIIIHTLRDVQIGRTGGYLISL